MRLSRLPGAVILSLMSSLLCEHYQGCTCHNRSGLPVLLLKSRLIKRVGAVRQLMRSAPLAAVYAGLERFSLQMQKSYVNFPEKPSCMHGITLTLLTVSYLLLTL